MKSELICPNCNEKLDIDSSEDLIFLNCSNKKCSYESVIDMDCISE